MNNNNQTDNNRPDHGEAGVAATPKQEHPGYCPPNPGPYGNPPPRGYSAPNPGPYGNPPPRGYSAPNPGPYGNPPPRGYSAPPASPAPGAYGKSPSQGAEANRYYPPQGNASNPGTYPPPPPQQKKKKKVGPLFFVLIGIMGTSFICVAALCIYFVISFAKKNIPEPTSPTYAIQDTTEAPIPTETLPMTTLPTETPETEPPTTEAKDSYEYIDDLNRRYDYYFDFLPDENGNVIAHSSSRLISKDELYGMTEHEVCIARNEIYARHGYIFQTEKYNEYFKNFSWYVPRTTTLPSLSDIEDQNVKLISAYEKERGW